jgi:hypothetical protein
MANRSPRLNLLEIGISVGRVLEDGVVVERYVVGYAECMEAVDFMEYRK